MVTITVRGIDDDIKARLRMRAAENGRSMEAEVRAILSHSLVELPPPKALGSRIRQRFAAIHASEELTADKEEQAALELPERSDLARPAGL